MRTSVAHENTHRSPSTVHGSPGCRLPQSISVGEHRWWLKSASYTSPGLPGLTATLEDALAAGVAGPAGPEDAHARRNMKVSLIEARDGPTTPNIHGSLHLLRSSDV
jgi:hypothetical protein